MPREVVERRPEVRCRGQVEAETREVDAGVGEQEEDGAELGDLVEAANQKAQLNEEERCNHSTEEGGHIKCHISESVQVKSRKVLNCKLFFEDFDM